MVDALRLCLSRSSFQGRRAATALSSPDIELLALELPPRTDQNAADYADIAGHEIRRLTTLKGDALQIAYWTLPRGTGRSPTALGAAATRQAVEELTRLCGEAGMDCEVVDATACAVVRAALLLAGPRPDAVWGVLDLGARQSRLTLCHGETPILARVIGEGGVQWTRRIAEELHISFEAAEIHKRDVGLEPSSRGVRGATAPPANPNEEHRITAQRELGALLFGILRHPLSRMVTEIERSYAYALSCYPSSRPLDVILTGGGACMNGLSQYLGDALGIAVRRLSDLASQDTARGIVGQGFESSFAASGASSVPLDLFAPAIGLALEGSNA